MQPRRPCLTGRWTDREEAQLKQLWPRHCKRALCYDFIAIQIGTRKPSQVKSKVQKLQERGELCSSGREPADPWNQYESKALYTALARSGYVFVNGHVRWPRGRAPRGTFTKVVAAVRTKGYQQCVDHIYKGDEDPEWIQSFFSIVQDEEVDDRERRAALRALDDEHAQLHAETEARTPLISIHY